MLLSGERQVAPCLDEIRRDHTARYEWAARFLPSGSRVVDMCCGVGYGSKILADAGHKVTALDISWESLEYARQHYGHPNIAYQRYDAAEGASILQPHDAAVCFEAIEHLRDPRPMLRELRRLAPLLLASVPNELGFPWNPGIAFHHRHYTPDQFHALLAECGFSLGAAFGQDGPESDVDDRVVAGRTALAIAHRASAEVVSIAPHSQPVLSDMLRAAPSLAVPESVAILGLGPSLEAYVDVTKRLGSRRKLCDEVWAINAAADVLHCDRVFHMDDVRVQEVRAAAAPDSNIAAMLGWLKKHPGPIYTSRPHPDYPGLVAYPLQDVMNACKAGPYFNSTAAYAVAYAVAIGVQRLHLFGCDFTYPNAHQAEQGRACVEFYLGIGRARGMVIGLPNTTSLMDGTATSDGIRLYGYDTVDVRIEAGDEETVSLQFSPHDRLPTADEIERRYDHCAHPNLLMRR